MIPQAINYIKSLTTQDKNLENFWNYFADTWLKRFPPTSWNTTELNLEDLVNRTDKQCSRTL